MSNYERKLTKVGNSYGITFPKEILKEAGITYGDTVKMELKDGKITLHKKEEIILPEGVDQEFMSVLTDVIKEHDVAFKGLVEK
ncbi:AbrB/MazE/SpoVT family DNA-binding domain-containing protein [Ornithinibacillus californiensis]|jgi:antitoxin MazE|uniref:AbrB/MazE/SpoVT family DNA-binding domain-containing protein n=1 Tax=Ornithinibacillus californiensis TaxID=161536 RepID=UPI00064DD2ED|nr:AbrB/MazE/SpoVT family DNA-binding domain-containing protein [Ornithinibacillus californiensis]